MYLSGLKLCIQQILLNENTIFESVIIIKKEKHVNYIPINKELFNVNIIKKNNTKITLKKNIITLKLSYLNF